MRKKYPYLQDSYYEDANSQTQRLNILSKLDDVINQKQYVKVTLLNWKEQPIKEIQGALSSGTLTKDGSSSVRRTCQFAAVIDSGEYNIEDSDMDFAINKKIFLEIGVDNETGKYEDYPILWFPQGVFFIASANVSSSTSSVVNISLTLRDKMCGLNGYVSGTFPATTILDEMDTQTASGEFSTQKVLVYDIIQEVVHHYGGEDLNNIVIEDVPLRIKQVMKWSGSNPLFLTPMSTTGRVIDWYQASLEKPEADGVIQIQNGTDAGYIYTDFTYTSELTATIGDTVTTVLDKIVQYLGNYEYFYDEFGVFHFREIKNYLNTTQAKVLLNDMSKHDYLVETTTGKSVYTFNDKTNLVQLSVTPKYDNIKNDYVIQGLRQGTNSTAQVTVRYHLAIDNKPECGTYYDLLLYKETATDTTQAIFPLSVATEDDLPMPGNFNLIYRIRETNKFVYWNNTEYKDVTVVAYYPYVESNNAIAALDIDEGAKNSINVYGGYKVKDWRTELYLRGLLTKNNGTDSSVEYQKMLDYSYYIDADSWYKDIYDAANRDRVDTDFYFEELSAFWPQVYDLENQQFIGIDVDQTLWTSSLTDGNYYLDFIDPSTSGLGQFAVNNIGRRTDAVNSNDVNCLFAPEIPDIVFLNTDSDTLEDDRAECVANGQPYTQVRGEMYYGFSIGGYKNAAFDQLKYELYVHTNYQQTVSITGRPAFYLEPNTRITINDSTTNTYGDYVTQNISFPLGAGNNMSVSANQCLERF